MIARKYAIALTAALGLFMGVLDDTIVNVALSAMSKAFNTTLTNIQWVVTGYLLVQAALIPIAGYFGNRYGTKRLFLGCLAIFTFGSFLCAIAPNEGFLIGFRLLQGVGAGALFPLGQILALSAFEPSERAASSALIGVPVLIAPVLGPTLGGWLVDNFGWNAIFLVNVPVGIIALVLGFRIFPNDNTRDAAKNPFDYVGLALSLVAAVVIVYGLNLVSQTKSGTTRTLQNPIGEVNGWSYWLVWTLLGIGLVLLVGFVFYELRQRDPVLDVRLFRNYNFSIANVVNWFNALVVFGSLLILPIFFQQVRTPPLSAFDAGLTQAPVGVGAIIGVILGAVLYKPLGPRLQVGLGLGLLVVSSYFDTMLTPTSDGWSLLPWLLMRGFGFSLTFIPVQTLALAELTGGALAKATSLFGITRQIFSSAGAAVVTTIYIQQTAAHYTVPQPPTQQAIGTALAQAGTSAVNDVYVFVTIGTLIITVLCVILIPSRIAESKVPADAPVIPAA